MKMWFKVFTKNSTLCRQVYLSLARATIFPLRQLLFDYATIL